MSNIEWKNDNIPMILVFRFSGKNSEKRQNSSKIFFRLFFKNDKTAVNFFSVINRMLDGFNYSRKSSLTNSYAKKRMLINKFDLPRLMNRSLYFLAYFKYTLLGSCLSGQIRVLSFYTSTQNT